jgi:hypothetical protein
MLQSLLETIGQSPITIFLFTVCDLLIGLFLVFSFEFDPGQRLLHHVDEVIHERFEVVFW